MVVTAIKMLSVSSRRKSSHFCLGTELRTSGSARLFQAMFLQYLPSHMILYRAETFSCSSRICVDRLQSRFRRSCAALFASLQICPSDFWELHRSSDMPGCWNAKSCLSSPSCLSKASQKHFPEAYLKQFLWSSYLWILHINHRWDGTALGGDCTKSTLSAASTSDSCSSPDALSSKLMSYKLLQLRLLW